MSTAISQGVRFKLRQLEENTVALRTVKANNPEYKSLKDAIAKEGVILPIAVTPCYQGDGKSPRLNDFGEQMFRIIDGLHRYTASKELGLDDIPVTVLSADDARVEKLQLMANAQRVKTRPSEFAAHLNRIMGRDPTRTISELAAELGFSGDWLSKILSINEIKSEETKKLINEGKITVSNAADLAKLPEDLQDEFVKDAVELPATQFGGLVAGRIKAMKEAKRKGQDATKVVGFVHEPHLRTKVEILNALQAPTDLAQLVKAAGLSETSDIVAFVLKWATKQDAQSVESAKAKYDARKAQRDEEQKRAKAQRDAERAKESAAEVAALPAGK